MPIQLHSDHPVYTIASQDFNNNRSAVSIQWDRIAQLSRPTGLHPLFPILDRTPLAGCSLTSVCYLLAMTALNYQFWSQPYKGDIVRYSHLDRIGAHAMQAAFQRAWMDHTTPAGSEAASLTATVNALAAAFATQGIHHYFGDIPEPASRLACLQEMLQPERLLNVATALMARMSSDARLDWQDAQVIANSFPESYTDPYLKKAQVALMFIAAEWRAIHGRDALTLDVTAAADYQLPKVLRSLGLLQYSPELADLVDNRMPITAGSAFERAIRGATVLACYGLAQQFGVGIDFVRRFDTCCLGR